MKSKKKVLLALVILSVLTVIFTGKYILSSESNALQNIFKIKVVDKKGNIIPNANVDVYGKPAMEEISNYITLKLADQPENYDEYGNSIPGNSIVEEQGVSSDKFEKVYVVDHLNIPTSAIYSWPVGIDEDGNESDLIMAWYIDEDDNNMYELYIGQKGGVIANPDSSFLFQGYKNVTTIDVRGLNSANVTNMSWMFANDQSLNQIIGVGSMDTSNVTSMNSMFVYIDAKDLHFISDLKTSNVTSMNGMFAGNYQLETLDGIENWDVSKVEDMSAMFHSCYNLLDIEAISNWDTSSVKSIQTMFMNDNKINGTFTIKGNPTDYLAMFTGAAIEPGSSVTINYSRNTTNIDQIIATKSPKSNIVKGVQID